jgi:hypothetical protein
MKAPVGVAEAEAEAVDETDITTDDVEDLPNVAEDEEVLEMTVPFLMYKESRLPAPVILINKTHGKLKNRQY